MDLTVHPTTGPRSHSTLSNEPATRAVAIELEAEFLAEMLKHAGVGESPEAFGGGIGEEQFSSFLRDAQAREIAERGGIGLAETIFNSLMEASNAR